MSGPTLTTKLELDATGMTTGLATAGKNVNGFGSQLREARQGLRETSHQIEGMATAAEGGVQGAVSAVRGLLGMLATNPPLAIFAAVTAAVGALITYVNKKMDEASEKLRKAEEHNKDIEKGVSESLGITESPDTRAKRMLSGTAGDDREKKVQAEKDELYKLEDRARMLKNLDVPVSSKAQAEELERRRNGMKPRLIRDPSIEMGLEKENPGMGRINPSDVQLRGFDWAAGAQANRVELAQRAFLYKQETGAPEAEVKEAQRVMVVEQRRLQVLQQLRSVNQDYNQQLNIVSDQLEKQNKAYEAMKKESEDLAEKEKKRAEDVKKAAEEKAKVEEEKQKQIADRQTKSYHSRFDRSDMMTSVGAQIGTGAIYGLREADIQSQIQKDIKHIEEQSLKRLEEIDKKLEKKDD